MSSSKHFKVPAQDPSDPVLTDLLKLNKPGATREGPTTFVGRVGMQPAMSMAAENERLKAERANGMVLLRLDPKKVTGSEFANRDAASLASEDAELQHLKTLISTQGQIEPIRVRPAPSGSAFEYEIVYGHRRHAACLLLDRETDAGYSVLALLDAAAVDRERLIKLMHAENDAHRQLSPYEYGRMYQSWLEAGIYDSQTTLAAAVSRDRRTISAYIRLAELPEVVLDAFGDRRSISLRWVDKLAAVLSTHRAALLEAAERVQAMVPRPTADEILRGLLGAGQNRTPSTTREETVKVDGRVACRIIRRDGRITLRLGSMVQRNLQKEIAEEIKELLETRLKQSTKGRSG